MHTPCRLLVLCFAVAGLTGCGIGYTTVTGNPAYPTDFQRNVVYVLQQDVFLIPTGGEPNVHYYAIGATKTANLGPSSVAEYEAKGAYWSERDVHLVSAGAKFRFLDLVLERNPEMGTMLWVVGQLVEVNAPKETGRVELAIISQRKPGQLAVYVDPAYLRPETVPATRP